jgi:hypothetical protein
MTAFYLSAECAECGGDAFTDGLTVTTEEHKGRPVIPFDIAAQATFVCADQECGATTVTGDFTDVMTLPNDGDED